MNAELEQWLAELRAEALSFRDGFGGANENLWRISISALSSSSVDELAAFLREAAAIRRQLVHGKAVERVTFYAWHDAQADQLRFSTALCSRESLPFRAAVCLLEHPDELARICLDSPYRDTDAPIPVWAERLV